MLAPRSVTWLHTPVAVGHTPRTVIVGLPERTLVLPEILLEFFVCARRRARRSVPHERVGDQLVDCTQIALAPRPLLPALDDRHRLGPISVLARHDVQYRRPDPAPASATSPIDLDRRVTYADEMATLVLTLVGDDRAGLVHAVAEAITAHGGNWERSQVAELAGQFAGIVLVTVPDDRSDELIGALEPLKGLLDITAHVALGAATGRVDDHRLTRADGVGPTGHRQRHHPCAPQHGVNIESLTTCTRHAPMAGGVLFEASAELEITPSVDLAALQVAGGSLANELMVDLTLET